LIKSLINDFRDYQKELLISHNDIKLDKSKKDIILAFLDDAAYNYNSSHMGIVKIANSLNNIAWQIQSRENCVAVIKQKIDELKGAE
jgi:hypothetical protein